MIRTTTNGVLRGYRYNLRRSSYQLNKSRETVLTQRNFNSFAEDPATAAQCFQLRRSYLHSQSQFAVGESVGRKYDVAYKAIESVLENVNTCKDSSAFRDVITGLSDTSGAGRNALGGSLSSLAKGIVQTMNSCRYGETFVFSGADGLNIPFTWEDDKLCYRGIPVDSQTPVVEMSAADPNVPATFDKDGKPMTPAPGTADTDIFYKKENGDLITKADYDKEKKNADALNYMAFEEKKNVDLGLGMQENEDGKIISSSVFDSSMQGITFLGYGTDKDGLPNNVVSIVARMGAILERCDPDSGKFASDADRDELKKLAEKFDDAADQLSDRHVEMTTRKAFLDDNQKQLDETANAAVEHFMGLEDADMAESITSFVYAKYCYDTSLKIGNSILSQSLMDYINT